MFRTATRTMKRSLWWLPAIFALFSFSSCIDILEVIRLNKDGSGTYTLRMDMGEMMNLFKAFGSMEDTTEGGLQEFAETRMDTILPFSAMPDSIKSRWQFPSVTQKGVMSMQLDAEQSVMLMEFRLPFGKINEVDQFGTDMNTAFDAVDSPFGNSSGDDAVMPFGAPDEFRFKPGRLERIAVPMDGLEDIEEEELSMMKMMMVDASYTVEYHLPGQVKKVEGLNYTISEDGSMVSRQLGFVNMLENQSNLGVVIQYK